MFFLCLLFLHKTNLSPFEIASTDLVFFFEDYVLDGYITSAKGFQVCCLHPMSLHNPFILHHVVRHESQSIGLFKLFEFE